MSPRRQLHANCSSTMILPLWHPPGASLFSVPLPAGRRAAEPQPPAPLVELFVAVTEAFVLA